MGATHRFVPCFAAGLLLIAACNRDSNPEPDTSSPVDSEAATDVAPEDTAAARDTANHDDTATGTDAGDTDIRDADARDGSAADGDASRDSATDAVTDGSGDTADTAHRPDSTADAADAGEVSDGDVSTPSDPFDPASCSGTAWTATQASNRLGSKDSEVLDARRVMERHRTCNSSGCSAWSTPEKTDIRYLTYSGGVTTRYTTLPANTSLVLFDDRGTPKLSVRHDTHLTKYPDAHDEGIVFGFPPMVEPYPRLRAWNKNPQRSSDYRDLENYLGRDAKLLATDHCVRFESVLPGRDEKVTTEYVAVYRY
jgi:hypothetical protein